MIDDIIKDRNFKERMEEHAREVIEYLLEKEESFSILCNISLVEFEPELPEEISGNFKPLTLFVLAGYTFESITIDEEFIYFEAGFGPDNFGSYVTVPLFGILQIIIDESVLFVNLTAGTEEFKTQKEEEEGIENSMRALLNNPENKKLLKKRK